MQIRKTRITMAQGLALTAALLLTALPGLAAPLNYVVTGGEIIVTATAGGQLLADPLEMPADGQNIVFDLAAGEVQSLSLTATGPVEVALNQPINGYDTLRIDSLSLTGTGGSLIEIGPIPPDVEYFALVENVVLNASFALVDDVLPDEPGDIMIPLGLGTGQFFIAMNGSELNMSGFAQADVPLQSGQLINFKADFIFTAVPKPTSAIPEPTSAIAFAIGLLPVAHAVRRGRKRRS